MGSLISAEGPDFSVTVPQSFPLLTAERYFVLLMFRTSIGIKYLIIPQPLLSKVIIYLDFFPLRSSSCSMTPLGDSTDSENFKSRVCWKKKCWWVIQTSRTVTGGCAGSCWPFFWKKVPFLCPLSVPDQFRTPPLRMPACHHFFFYQTNQVLRYQELHSHVAGDRRW